MKYKKIKFKNKEYFLIGSAIATREQYEQGKPSYAHLFRKDIMRHGKKIGIIDDLELIGEEKLEPKVSVFEMIDNFLFKK